MKKTRSGLVAALVVAALMLMCVGAQGYLALQSGQVVGFFVSGGEQAWAALVDYVCSSVVWQGPEYGGFNVVWTASYGVWYGVYSYSATQAKYVDWVFIYRDY